ncbi:hypothetical protein ALC56_14664, partial [Trachymyrmex septentrionalis]
TMCSRICCNCKLTNFSSSIVCLIRHNWTPFYPDFHGERISLPGECIVLDVGAFLERRDAAYRCAEDEQMIRSRIKCTRGAFSGVHCCPQSAGVNEGQKNEEERIHRPDGQLAFRRATLIDT